MNGKSRVGAGRREVRGFWTKSRLENRLVSGQLNWDASGHFRGRRMRVAFRFNRGWSCHVSGQLN